MPPLTDEVYAACEPHIQRESWYWSRKFPVRAQVSVDDLRQEGWIVAMRVAERFQDSNGAALTTFLTTCLRNRFKGLLISALRKRRVRQEFTRAQGLLPRGTSDTEILVKLRSLQNDDRRYAAILYDHDWDPVKASRAAKIPVALLRRRLARIMERV